MDSDAPHIKCDMVRDGVLYASVAQLVRASVWYAEGQWFESTHLHQLYVPVAQLEEHSTFNRVVESSSLSRHTNGLIAKTVYAVDWKSTDVGSIPTQPTS